ncbi:acyltransferase [Colwellia sp. MEBiC06753]
MLSWLPSFILLPVSFVLFSFNLAFSGSFVFLGGLLKLLIPFKWFHRILYRPMHTFYRLWTYNNTLIIRLTNNVTWQVSGADQLNKDAWYLVMANHQSWLDILVVAEFARTSIPEPKFFLKESLKKVPFLGMACWALNMPFMKRYSKAFLAKHPELIGQDIETTKKSCQSFRDHPTTIINFVEGTRFTSKKHQQQQSTFNYLLKPKAGGIAFTLATLGEQFDKVLNVTLLYPENPGHVMKDMLCGRLTKIIVQVEQIEVSEALIGDYDNDPVYKTSFQSWLNQQWQQKDLVIEKLYRQNELESPVKTTLNQQSSS